MFSDPVVGTDFFGRQDVLETLRKRVEAFASGYRQNVALIGHQKLGKTSALHQLIRGLEHLPVLPVYVELRSGRLDAFAEQFIRSVLFEYLKRRESIDALESYETLVRLARQFIPETVQEIEKVRADLKRSDKESAYTRLFELTSLVHKETGTRCVVVLDEFHRLGELGVRNAFQIFGRRIMVQKDTLYLISSSSYTISRLILAEKLSLLFGNFERIHLEPFSFETSRKFIESRLDPVRLPEELEKYLIALTNGHPFFLNVITAKVRQLALLDRREAAGVDIVVEALKQLFFDSEGVLNQYFVNLTARWSSVKGGQDCLTLLVHLAQTGNKLKDLTAALGKSARETSRQLKELLDAELILKNGVFYHFHDKLFQFWLRFVHQSRTLSLLIDTPSKAAYFRIECRKSIDAFTAASRFAPRKRIQELLKRFRNELVEFDHKGRQLPAFQEVAEASGGGDEAPILARTPKRSEWVCQVIEKHSTERDVRDFLRRCGRRGEGTKKVLFALSGMDANAKLLAKNKHIWTLNLQKVNALMDFYNLSKIVLFKEEPEPPRQASAQAPLR